MHAIAGMMIIGLSYIADRSREAEDSRAFYAVFLGLPFVVVLHIGASQTVRDSDALHTFFRMDDGSFLAFFDDPDTPFDFKAQHDFDLHIALEVDHQHLQPMLERGREAGIESRGISDHGFIDSIYFRDPNGYVIELTAIRPVEEGTIWDEGDPRDTLSKWTRDKTARQ